MVSIICFVSAFHAALKLARSYCSWCRHGVNVYPQMILPNMCESLPILASTLSTVKMVVTT